MTRGVVGDGDHHAIASEAQKAGAVVVAAPLLLCALMYGRMNRGVVA